MFQGDNLYRTPKAVIAHVIYHDKADICALRCIISEVGPPRGVITTD